MAEDIVLPIPNLELPQQLFVLSKPQLSHLHDSAQNALLEGIKADQMAPYYRIIASASPGLSLDQSLLEEMERTNQEQLKRLDERLEEAEKTEGESEISDALRAKANYLTRIGDKDRAIAALKLALEKTPMLGSRIDIVLTLIRIGFFFGDHEVITSNLTKAEKLVEEGGDWDRRNRLKVYNGLHLLSIRQFKRGGELFSDALSTFTASELLPYNDFVALTVISNTLTLNRVDLKKKIISAPEVIQVLPEVPVLGDLVKNLYECHYDKFFIALASLEQTYLLPSRILNPHTRFYIREMRILAYNQLLESYRSLTLESLSGAFGVSVDFVDNELSRFIANGRLHCTIDKVYGVVETTRPSLKNAQYETVIRQGDVLLNQIQRLLPQTNAILTPELPRSTSIVLMSLPSFLLSFVEIIHIYLRNCLLFILAAGPIPAHVAFVMDGNRRYARSHQQAVQAGHGAGFMALRGILEICLRLGVKCVSAYAFSIENFKREKGEVDALMSLAEEKLEELCRHGDLLDEYGVRLNIIGKTELLPESVQRAVQTAENMTRYNDRAILNICLPYTSRDEIASAVQSAVQAALQSAPATDSLPTLTEHDITSHLMITRGGSPPLDVLVRTSGVKRLSDFMLWQCCENTQIHFTNTYWPDFGLWDLVPVILDYQRKVWSREIQT